MSYAYTPGLKVKDFAIVSKTRALPIPGDVLVKEGDLVESHTIVARTMISGNPHVVQVSAQLDVQERDLEYYMLKKQGEPVHEGEIIAMHQALFGLVKTYVKSPTTGVIEFISTLTGQVSIREPPRVLDVDAYIRGRVTKVVTGKGAVIETPAAFVQGILGVGGERRGKLMTITSPDEVLRADLIDSKCSGRVLVGGAYVDSETLFKATQMGVVGIVVGGISKKELNRFIGGYDMGVAITGRENVALTLIITEGFGRMSMASRTFELLKSFNDWEASINGATQIRAGVIRPEIIIPLKDERVRAQEEEQEDIVHGLVSGMRVRIIRDPWFGSIGRVINLPRDYFRIETEAEVRVLEIELAEGNRVIIPRTNVEIIEE